MVTEASRTLLRRVRLYRDWKTRLSKVRKDFPLSEVRFRFPFEARDLAAHDEAAGLQIHPVDLLGISRRLQCPICGAGS